MVENPATERHYLTENFPYLPSLVDRNRRLRGDAFCKPTKYWFVNCEPTGGASYTGTKNKKVISKLTGHTGSLCDEGRSMISPDYARNFICDFILGIKQTLDPRPGHFFSGHPGPHV